MSTNSGNRIKITQPKKGAHEPYGSGGGRPRSQSNGWGSAMQSSDGDDHNTTTSSSTTTSPMNEQSPLVERSKSHKLLNMVTQQPLAMPLPYQQQQQQKPRIAHQSHYLALVNKFNVREKVEPLITHKINEAQQHDQITFTVFAFALMHDQREPVAIKDCGAFELNTDNVLSGSGTAKAISLEQLCVDIQGAQRIYMEISVMIACIAQNYPSVRVIVQKQAFKQRITPTTLWGRTFGGDVYAHGFYYKVIGNFALQYCHSSSLCL